MKVGQVNEFLAGIDKDSSIHRVANNSVIDAVNLSMSSNHHIGDIATMRGTLERASIFEDTPLNFRICGSVATCGLISNDCNTYVKKRGILYFTFDDRYKSNVVFFDPVEKKVHQLFPAPVDRFKNELGFTSTTLVDAIAFEEKENCYVRFVDNESILRKIEVKQGEGSCISYPLAKSLSIRPLSPIDCLSFDEVQIGGALVAGGYQFAFRYYNTATCNASAFSHPTNIIPIIRGENGCNKTETISAWGSRVGEVNDKKILLDLLTSEGAAGFDAVQLLIIRHIDGSTNVPGSGLLLSPSISDFQDKKISFTGMESGVTINLADYLIDDLPILAAKTITSKDERDFLGNIKVQTFEMDHGALATTGVKTIEQSVGNFAFENAYKCEADTVKYKSYMRGEVYAFGVYIFDQFGNGVVCPLDLSEYDKTTILFESVSAYTITSSDAINGIYTIIVSNQNHTWAAGDWVGMGAVVGEVIKVENANILTIKGTIAAFTGNVDLLYGQKGNQGTSWAWRFPERSDNQFTIFNKDGDITALGLKVTGLKNWPSWAKGFEIVRKKRIKDILYQIPHIPTIGVRGSYIPATVSDYDVSWDYDGSLNTITPKLHRMGHARNLYSHGLGGDAFFLDPMLARWVPQTNVTDANEVSSLIFGLPPEYLYNNGAEAFDLRTLGGGYAEIADAVALQVIPKHSGFSNTYPGDSLTSNVYAAIFAARNRGNYFYNREGINEENGVGIFGKKIQEMERFQAKLANWRTDVDYQMELARDHPFVILPSAPMTDESYNEIVTYGNIIGLATQQKSHPAMPSSKDGLFYTASKNQKGILFKLEEPLEDFSKLMAESSIEHNDNYFPLLDWNPIVEIYGSDHLMQTFDNLLGGVTTTVPAGTNSVPSQLGDVVAGAYILNIKKGLGDDRYGGISESGEWMSTGVCQLLSKNDIDGNRSFDLEVFGGDVFITKHSLKANEMSPRTVFADPIDAELPSLSINKVSRVGVHEKNVEILDLYLESSVNAAYERVIDKYPGNRNNQLSSFTGARDYLYNPGYSAENSIKVHVTKLDFCKDTERLKAAVVYSDRHVRGGESNPFSDIEGFDTYRVNNILFFGQHGDVMKVDVLEDKILYVFQERGIKMLPIGVSELRTVDAAIVATGTSDVVGIGVYDIPRDVGTQHMQTIHKRMGQFYGTDAAQKVAYTFGSKGASFRFISWEKMNTHFQSYLNKPLLEHELTGHIDPVAERYFLNRGTREKSILPIIAYNIKMQYWETQWDIPVLANGTGDQGQLFWINNEGVIHEMYEGVYQEYFGEKRDSSFTFVVNTSSMVTKLIQSIQSNSNFAPNAVQVSVYDEAIETGRQVTPLLEMSAARNQNEYFLNTIREKVGGVSKKLRGRVFVVKFIINNTNGVVINSVTTKLRQIK